MSTLSLKLDQPFIVLLPELVVDVAGTFNFPDEVEFVQKFLSIKSKYVIVMISPLIINPHA
jgi:hypothetical protein